MNATLRSSIKIPQHFSAAAPLKEFIMHNFCRVPANMSARCCSAMNCCTHGLDRTLSPRHVSTWQLADTIECNKCFSNCRVHVSQPSPIQPLGIFPTKPLHRSPDRCWESTAVIAATRSLAVSKRSSQTFFGLRINVSSSLGSSVLPGRFIASAPKAHLHRPCSCSIRVLHSSECHPLISVALPNFSGMCRLRSILRARTAVHSS